MKFPGRQAIFLFLSSASPPPLGNPVLLFRSGAGAGRFHRGAAESFSTSSSPSPSHSTWRQHDEESKSIKVAVWWDFENCNIPNGVNVYRVTHSITSTLRSHGIRGPVAITAFGDVSQLSRSTQEALYTSGVCLNHVPNCGKNSSDRSLLVDLVYWVAQNPPPVHFFLISGDRDFANILHRLRMNNYNILLASTDSASSALCSAATVMWQWNAIVRGESLNGRYFNHPPDGLYGSWYGHYKGSLEDPFSYSEQPTSPQPEESMESLADAKPRPIPKALVNRIRQTLYMYPEGVSLVELRLELKKYNVAMDKDYFGYKKFSNLLLSMPNILKIKSHPSGPLAYGIHQRTVESVQSSLKPTVGTGVGDGYRDRRRTAEDDGKLSHLTSEPSAKQPPSFRDGDVVTSPQDSDVKNAHKNATEKEHFTLHKGINVGSAHQDIMDTSHKDFDENTSTGKSKQVQEDDVVIKKGLFGRIWRTWIGNKFGDSSEKSTHTSKSGSPGSMEMVIAVPVSAGSFNGSQKIRSNEDVQMESDHSGLSDSRSDIGKCVHCSGSDKLRDKGKDAEDPLGSHKRFLDASKSVRDEKIAGLAAKQDDTPGLNSGFFIGILSWCNFWKAKTNNHYPISQNDCDIASSSITEIAEDTSDRHKICDKNVNQLNCQREPHDLFLKAHFWDSMESFLRAPKGLDMISKSRTREDMVQGLQKEGPLVLSALKEGHLLHLVDLLIMEKKWVGECASRTFPFKLTFPAKRSCVPSHSHGLNGLQSIFSRKTSQSNSEMLAQHEIRDQNPQPLTNSFDGSVPKNCLDLKAWFCKICNSSGGIESKDFQKHFEREFNKKVDCSYYGYFTVENLIAACLVDDKDHLVKRRNPSKISREDILSDCKNLLTDFFDHNPEGFNVGLFKPMFFRRYGYALDYQMLGYPKLASLLQIMPGVRIESSLILPAGIFPPDSSDKKAAADVVQTYSEENKKGKTSNLDDEDPTDDEDCVWEELGPVSESEICGNDTSNQYVKEKAEFNGYSISGEGEFSYPEDEPPTMSDASKAQGHDRRSDGGSSLLQILDSWYGSMEGGERDQSQAVDGLVDCSRKNGCKPLDSSCREPKPHRSYSFVSNSEVDEKEKLIDSLLGSLKKPGDSTPKDREVN